MNIRRCRADEISRVMEFIRIHWAQNHLLSWHEPLMQFQHGDPIDPEHFNWLLAVEGDEVAGVLGYIPTRIYDDALGAKTVLWLALWKLNDKIVNAGLGIKMLRALEKIEPNAAIGVLGINPEHPPMYKALGYVTGELHQHVLFAANSKQTIAVLPEGFTPSQAGRGTAKLVLLTEALLAEAVAISQLGERVVQMPKKSATYFSRRYLSHPLYSYSIYQIVIGQVAKGILVTRLAEHEGACALRIVDAFCDPCAFGELGPALNRLLAESGAEYVDIWEHGVSDAYFTAAGFQRVSEFADLIVPNFFEPFSPRNGRIEFAFKSKVDASFVLFRGDGDQDRPNQLVEEARPS